MGIPIPPPTELDAAHHHSSVSRVPVGALVRERSGGANPWCVVRRRHVVQRIVGRNAGGVVRSFSGFAAALDEIKNARVFGGIHFRTACNDGTALGSAIGNYVIHHPPLPKHREREDSRGR